MNTQVESHKEQPNFLSSSLPSTYTHVLVQCSRYRCLGYVDETGKWREVYHNTEIKEVIGWEPL